MLNVQLFSLVFFLKDPTICLCKDLDLTNSIWRTVPWICLQVVMGPWVAIITQCHHHRACQCRIRWQWARDSRWATMGPDQTWICNQTKVSEVSVSFCKRKTSWVQFFLKVLSCRFPPLNVFVPCDWLSCLEHGAKNTKIMTSVTLWTIYLRRGLSGPCGRIISEYSVNILYPCLEDSTPLFSHIAVTFCLFADI